MTAVATSLFDRRGWWDETCREFRSLRAVNAFRLELLRRWLPEGVAGATVIDLGCGGGLFAAPLAADGAKVVAVDLGLRALLECRANAGPNLHAIVGDAQNAPLADGCADLVLLADVLEHVAEPAEAVTTAARLLRPGGALFVNTIARTRRSRWLAIGLAEGLGYVPRGTHRWADFVQPSELDAMAAAVGLVHERRVGEQPLLLRTLRTGAIQLRESDSLAVGYAALYRRTV